MQPDKNTSVSKTTHVVYLLHFDGGYLKYRHYIGITTPDRLLERIHRHELGIASKFTQRLIQAGAKPRLARTWFTNDPNLERDIKARGHATNYCPLCKEQPTGELF